LFFTSPLFLQAYGGERSKHPSRAERIPPLAFRRMFDRVFRGPCELGGLRVLYLLLWFSLLPSTALLLSSRREPKSVCIGVSLLRASFPSGADLPCDKRLPYLRFTSTLSVLVSFLSYLWCVIWAFHCFLLAFRP